MWGYSRDHDGPGPCPHGASSPTINPFSLTVVYFLPDVNGNSSWTNICLVFTMCQALRWEVSVHISHWIPTTLCGWPCCDPSFTDRFSYLSKVIQLVRTEQNPPGSRFHSLNQGDVFSLIHSGQFTFLVNDFGALVCFGIRSPYGQIFLFCHQQPFHSGPPWMSDTLISG